MAAGTLPPRKPASQRLATIAWVFMIYSRLIGRCWKGAAPAWCTDDRGVVDGAGPVLRPPCAVSLGMELCGRVHGHTDVPASVVRRPKCLLLQGGAFDEAISSRLAEQRAPGGPQMGQITEEIVPFPPVLDRELGALRLRWAPRCRIIAPRRLQLELEPSGNNSQQGCIVARGTACDKFAFRAKRPR